jgi:hypothetical protein
MSDQSESAVTGLDRWRNGNLLGIKRLEWLRLETTL